MPDFTSCFSISAKHPCLSGHFPDRPIVPAVLLLQAVADALRPHVGNRAPIAVNAAKFLLPVLPEQALTLQLKIDHATAHAHFRCSCEGQIVAQGRMRYASTGPHP